MLNETDTLVCFTADLDGFVSAYLYYNYARIYEVSHFHYKIMSKEFFDKCNDETHIFQKYKILQFINCYPESLLNSEKFCIDWLDCRNPRPNNEHNKPTHYATSSIIYNFSEELLDEIIPHIEARARNFENIPLELLAEIGSIEFSKKVNKGLTLIFERAVVKLHVLEEPEKLLEEGDLYFTWDETFGLRRTCEEFAEM